MNAENITIAGYAASGAGIAMVALSFVFPYVFTDVGAWSNANAAEFQAANAELYRLRHVYSGHNHDHADGEAHAASVPAELAAAQERFDAAQRNLKSSVGGRHTMRSALFWLGVLLTLAGVGAAVWLRIMDGEN